MSIEKLGRAERQQFIIGGKERTVMFNASFALKVHDICQRTASGELSNAAATAEISLAAFGKSFLDSLPADVLPELEDASQIILRTLFPKLFEKQAEEDATKEGEESKNVKSPQGEE